VRPPQVHGRAAAAAAPGPLPTLPRAPLRALSSLARISSLCSLHLPLPLSHPAPAPSPALRTAPPALTSGAPASLLVRAMSTAGQVIKCKGEWAAPASGQSQVTDQYATARNSWFLQGEENGRAQGGMGKSCGTDRDLVGERKKMRGKGKKPCLQSMTT